MQEWRDGRQGPDASDGGRGTEARDGCGSQRLSTGMVGRGDADGEGCGDGTDGGVDALSSAVEILFPGAMR